MLHESERARQGYTRMMRSAASILIVDDDQRLRRLLSRFLLREGYQVCEAGNADEMRRTVTTRDVDLVVLDLMLPNSVGGAHAHVVNRSAGAQLLIRYHESVHPKEERSFRVIVFTAIMDGEMTQRLHENMDAEMDAYINKTVTLEEFRTAVRLFMASGEARSE